ncbi:MAG: AraC family transcriptional regulator [Desulfobacterales bacterium]|nr:AraC family transcriptional regulator [Desulfobacterales bacterium]
MKNSMGYTMRDYQRRICQATDYIRQHLRENPSLDDIAHAASFSKFHFHRVFHALVGETVGQFTRRLRLEKAANWLIFNKHYDITSIAMELGFSSSQNFARAFQKHFGQSPSKFRQLYPNHRSINSKDQNLAPWPPVFDVDSIEWANPSTATSKNIKVKEMPELHVAYVRYIGWSGPEDTRQAFERLLQWVSPRGLMESGTFISAYWDNPYITPRDNLRLDACITVPKDTETSGEIRLQTLPRGTYAMYHCTIRADEFTETWAELILKWLPGIGYNMSGVPIYEIYHNNGYEAPDGKWVVDMYCPVKPLE